MVDPLEEFQRKQSIRITRDIIGQSEEHEQRMQAASQKLWENAHKHLVALLRFLDQDYDESCEKANRPLESFSDDDLAYLIQVRLHAVRRDSSKQGIQDEAIDVKNALNELSQRYGELEQALLTVEEKNKKLLDEKSALEVHLSALRQIQAPIEEQPQTVPVQTNAQDGISVPDWITAWRKTKLFEKTSTAIILMGETGVALRPSLIKQMAARLSLSGENKGLDEAVNWLMRPEDSLFPALAEEIVGLCEQGSSAGGNLPTVLRLTEAGKNAYQLLTGKVALESRFDSLLKRHASPEHTILNIQVLEVLVEEGYQIRGQAQSIQLPDGSYIPDIVAVDPRTGEMIFIEVERDVHKDKISRKQKWMRAYEASNGNVYVFCDNLACQRAVQAEINLALEGLAYRSYLTNLHGIWNGKRSVKDKSIWLSQKQSR